VEWGKAIALHVSILVDCDWSILPALQPRNDSIDIRNTGNRTGLSMKRRHGNRVTFGIYSNFSPFPLFLSAFSFLLMAPASFCAMLTARMVGTRTATQKTGSFILRTNGMIEINVVWLAFEPPARVAFVRQIPFSFSLSLFPR
jgi:hypothetical protein